MTQRKSMTQQKSSLVLWIVAALAAAAVPADQFAQLSATQIQVEVARDKVWGEWVNLETQLIKPILVTDDGAHVVVANPADDRVVVFDADLTGIVAEVVVGQGPAALAERSLAIPGTGGGPDEIWVSVRHQSSIVVIDKATWRVTAILRPPIDPAGVGAGRAAAPGGIAFNRGRTKAYVASTFTDELLVFDAEQKTFMTEIPLTFAHHQSDPFPAMNDPMAVIGVDDRIFVVSHLSGNQTIVDTFDGSPVDDFGGPDTVTVKNLAGADPRSLPDFDVMEINAATDLIDRVHSGVGTTLFGIVYHGGTNELVVSSFEAANGQFKGETAFPDGRVVSNRLTRILPDGSTSEVVTEDLGAAGEHVVMPTDLAVDALGRLYVAGYASANVGVFDDAGQFLATLPAAAGPRGLAFAGSTNRLYVASPAASTVAYYNVAGPPPAGPEAVATLPDPGFDDVREGRRVFLDATHSGSGTTGCFSCHQDLRKDGLGWVLGAFFDTGTEDTAPLVWKDNKGVMVTQDLRSLAGVAPYHWRGEQEDLEDFNATFEKLLAGTPHSAADFASMKAFVFSAVYPPNPFQQMNRGLSLSAAVGAVEFTTPSGDLKCTICHALPTGTDASISDPLIGSGFEAMSVKPAQLKGLWTKSSSLADIDADPYSNEEWPSTGFGFVHDGPFDNLFKVLEHSFMNIQHEQTVAFLDELDTGLAPATMYSEWLTSGTAGASRIGSYLIPQANAGHCDVAARGRLRFGGPWIDAGLVWNRAARVFVPDRDLPIALPWPVVEAMAVSGDAELLVLGVPLGSGERIGVDRDRDLVFDGHELAAGTDPTDPDTDGDGHWDGYDPDPPGSAPEVVEGSVELVYATTNTAKVVYETDTFSNTRVEFGLAGGETYFSGDPPALPAGSTRWKRRHTAFLRPQPDQGLSGLDDGGNYVFRIHTRGQNGATAVSQDFALSDLGGPLRVDFRDPNVRIASLDLSLAADSTWKVTAQLVDSDGVHLVADEIRLTGRFTHRSDTGAFLQVSATADNVDDGIMVFTSSVVQDSGDMTIFDIAMHVAVESPTRLHPPPDFNWSESVTCVEGEVP